MSLYLKILALVFGIIFFSVFLSLIKKRSIKPFYTVLWLFISLFMISIVAFEKFYKSIANLLGITDASFLIIVGLISFLLIYVLYLSIKISELSDRIQELISHSSILDNEIQKMKNDQDKA
ncbi:MAG: DUF2304 domain-containing protein [Thiohalospira sp.]